LLSACVPPNCLEMPDTRSSFSPRPDADGGSFTSADGARAASIRHSPPDRSRRLSRPRLLARQTARSIIPPGTAMLGRFRLSHGPLTEMHFRPASLWIDPKEFDKVVNLILRAEDRVLFPTTEIADVLPAGKPKAANEAEICQTE